MWVQASGSLSEDVYMVTTPASTHMLVDGDVVALVDTGIAALTPQLISEIEMHLGGLDRLQYVFLTHADFDHVGGVAGLRAAAPQLKLISSPSTAELLSSDEVIEAVTQRNTECAEAILGVEGNYSVADWKKALTVDKVMGDGDSVDLGNDVEIKLFFTPGHTNDSVSYFVPNSGALAGGEAVGSYRGRDLLTPCFTTGYADYLASIDKLLALDIHSLILPHGGAITGELSQKYLASLRLETERLYNEIKEQLSQGVLVEEVVKAILPEWRSANISPEGPFYKAQEESLAQMVQVVAEGK